MLDAWLPETPGANSVQLIGVENLTGLTLVDQKLAVWAVTFAVEIGCDLENPTAALAEFLTFHADIDVEPYSDPPDGALPAARDAAFRVEIPR